MQHLSEDVAMHRFDLKHTMTVKLRAKEQEKKARDKLRVTAYELRMVENELQIAKEELKTVRGDLRVVKARQQADKDELQVVRYELRLKTMALNRVFQEVSEAKSTVGRLNDECRELRDDL